MLYNFGCPNFSDFYSIGRKKLEIKYDGNNTYFCCTIKSTYLDTKYNRHSINALIVYIAIQYVLTNGIIIRYMYLYTKMYVQKQQQTGIV